MIRIGWFCPVSTRTGISRYAAGVLRQLVRLRPPGQLQVVVFHPPTDDRREPMPCPTVALDRGLLESDFHALCDVAVYHLGNNDLHHGPIYAALLRHPGIVVLHDHVYQHYLAGAAWRAEGFTPGLGALVHAAGGQPAFEVLADSGVLDRSAGVAPRFVPWEEQWATTVPLGNLLARLGSAAVVHSAYAESGLAAGSGAGSGGAFPGPVRRLFLPRPDLPADLPPIGGGERIHLVCCGHIGPTKGLQLLVDAFALDPALADRFRVTIAGFGSAPDFLDELRERIRSSGQGRAFELVVDPDEAAFAAVMAAADVFYNLRYPNTEGASLSLAEQLAHGRPVIAYRSGCFAELPDEACYFLDAVEDVEALAALLGRIAADRAELPQRGGAAGAAVRGQTDARYAQELLAWIEDNRALLARRAALSRARAEGRLPAPVAEDAGWFDELAAARIRFQEFHAGQLLLPPGLAACDPPAQARYLLLNLLHHEPDEASLQEVAAILAGLPPLARIRLAGELVLLAGTQPDPAQAALTAEARRQLKPGSAPLWRVLLRLAPERAIPAALDLLELADEAGEADEAALIRDARRSSNALALAAKIESLWPEVQADLQPESGPESGSESGSESPPEAASEPQSPAAAIRRLILAEAARRALAPVAPGTELVALLRGPKARDSVVLGGFHEVEPVGIWSSTPDSTLRLRLPAGAAAQALEARLTSLVPDTAIEIEVCEEAGGRQAALAVTGTAEVQDIRLPLPEVSGVLRISLRVDALQSPAECGKGSDSRRLGVRLLQLRLTGAGPR